MKISTTMVIGALALAATIGAARVASAGKKQIYDVQVNLAARNAQGAMGDARRSSDASQHITITIYTMGTYSSAFAAFSDANGVSANCYTTEPAVVAAFQAVKSDGHVYVEWDLQGKCTAVWNFTSSTRSVKEQ